MEDGGHLDGDHRHPPGPEVQWEERNWASTCGAVTKSYGCSPSIGEEMLCVNNYGHYGNTRSG